MDWHILFRYIILFFLFSIGAICIFVKKLELIGIGIVFLIHFINSYFLAIDVYFHPITQAGYTTFMILLFPSLLFLFVSSLLIMITLTNLHAIYVTKGSKITISGDNKKKLTTYEIIFISCFFLITILSFLFFFLQPSDSDFFEDTIYGKSIYFSILKYVSFGTLLGLSAYSVYLSNELSQLPDKSIT